MQITIEEFVDGKALARRTITVERLEAITHEPNETYTNQWVSVWAGSIGFDPVFFWGSPKADVPPNGRLEIYAG